MRRNLAAAIVAACVAFTTTASWSSPADSPTPPVAEQLKQAADAFAAKSCERAAPLVDEIIARPDFAYLGDTAGLQALAISADCAIAQERWADAWRAVKKATAYQSANARLWRWRLVLAMDAKEPEDAVASLEGLAARAPEMAAGLEDRTVFGLYRALDEARQDALALRMLTALELSGWKPKDALRSDSHLWLHGARLLADKGDLDTVARLLLRVRDPHDLVKARLDRRFATLLAARPELFDLRAATERRLQAMRAVAAAEPRRLEAVGEIAWSLAVLGRQDEALGVLDDADARLRDPGAFDDLDDGLSWFRTIRAMTLGHLGRDDEALRDSATAVEVDPGPFTIVNHAERLLYRDRPAEALQMLDRLDDDDLTPYQRGVAVSTRACALFRLGRKGEFEALAPALAAAEAAHPQAVVVAFLCADDLDRAAAVTKRTLADPARRGTALMALSDFRDPPSLTPLHAEINRRDQRLRARRDVTAAVKAVGHTEIFDITL